jgi:hypothetical protein
MRIKQIRSAWAIDTKSDEGHQLIGIYYFTQNKIKHPHPACDGCRIALFRTRHKARIHLHGTDAKEQFPKARVIKVRIIVEEIK